MRNFRESIRFTSLSLARWGLFCFITVLLATSAWAAPITLVFNGQLITADATLFTETRNCSGTIQIGTKESDGTFRSLKTYTPTFRLNPGGAFEVSIADSWLRDLDYASNDYYLKFKINATTPPTPEFTSQKLAVAPYAFMAYHQKGGQVYAVGDPPLIVGNARVKGEMQGANFGIKGRGNYEYGGYHAGATRGANVDRLGTMEVYGYLMYNDGIKKYALYASTGTYDPRYNSYSSIYPSDYGYALHATAWKAGTPKGIGIYGKSTSATKAAVYCENIYSGPGPRGNAITFSDQIQLNSQAAGKITYNGGSSPPMAVVVNSPYIKSTSVILLTVQNGYKERVWAHNVVDGSFWIVRDFSSGVSPTPSLDIAYLIIN